MSTRTDYLSGANPEQKADSFFGILRSDQEYRYLSEKDILEGVKVSLQISRSRLLGNILQFAARCLNEKENQIAFAELITAEKNTILLRIALESAGEYLSEEANQVFIDDTLNNKRIGLARGILQYRNPQYPLTDDQIIQLEGMVASVRENEESTFSR